MVDLGEGPGGHPLLFWVKEEEMTKGRKSGRTSKKMGPLITSRSGSATGSDGKCRILNLKHLKVMLIEWRGTSAWGYEPGSKGGRNAMRDISIVGKRLDSQSCRRCDKKMK